MVVALLAAVTAAVPQAQAQEDAARRRLESGRAFLASQNYGEALKDFQTVVQTYPTSSVADDALLEIARYELDVARDPGAADTSVETLLKQFPDSDAAPMALVLKGRIALAGGQGPDQINAALASFERVPRLYDGSDAIPAALFYAGDAARLGGRRDEALARFAELTSRYPRSSWNARGLLASARSLVASGQPLPAMERLQRLRTLFPATSDAVTALEWNTILYRLYVRPPDQPPFTFNVSIGGPTGRFRDVADIGLDAQNHLIVAAKAGITILGSGNEVLRSVNVADPRSIVVGTSGRPVTIHDDGGLRDEGKPATMLATTTSDGKVKPLKLAAGVTTSAGDVLVADRDLKTLLRFSADGRPKGEFARQIPAKRLAISDLDEVAALDTDAKSIVVLGADGKVRVRIAERGAGYELRQPVDVKFDRLGHLYVLDRAAVQVFSGQDGRPIASLSVAEKSPGAFGNPQALALDSAGRMYVFDTRTNTVQVYQ